MDVPTASLERMRELYAQGLYLQAYAIAEPLGPLQHWRGAPARIFAGRLAGNLGGLRLAEALHLRVGRDAPDDLVARYYQERAVFGRRGPFVAWERVERWPALDGTPDWLRADWHALEAGLFARLRDFERADRCIGAALRAAPDRSWIHVEHAFVHEAADRYGESLAAAQEALALHPWYRPAVQAAAEALVQLGRDDDALALLIAAAEHLESHLVVARLIQLLVELERHAEADRWLDRYVVLAPLAERRLREWVAGRRADVAHALGDRPRAIAAAREAGAGFYTTVADRQSAAPPDARRVRLPVGFVRQHHMTCAPATLAAMARYWDQPEDHLQIADAICYDGTTSLKERDWAVARGYVVREFRVTWAAARALIDAGLPFALTTFEPGSAHLQAVIGYDDARGTLLVRDPSDRESHELLADPGLDRWQAQGPRGMCMVPAAEAHRLDACPLPDAELYDIVHDVHAALDRHDWDGAQAAVARLEAAAPGHRLTWHAKATCAGYAGNRPAQLQATDRLRKLHPDDVTLALVRLGQMRDLYPRRARVEWLRDRCYGAGTHPAFWRQYAQELMEDGRTYGHAAYWMRRVLRQAPFDGIAWYLQANLWWRLGRREAAGRAYHVAACLSDTDEDLARAWFNAQRELGDTAAGLRWLTDRFARLGEKSAGPAITLAGAYRSLERVPDALRVLNDARARRPLDPVLDLELAELRAAIGDAAGAAALLARARGRAWPMAVERTAAAVAAYAEDWAAAGEAWAAVHAWQPLALDAVRGVAQHRDRTGGPDAAIVWLRAEARRWPCFVGVRVHLAERLSRGQLPEALAVLREAAALDDADGWIRREIVDDLGRLGRTDEAFAEAEEARLVEPQSPAWFSIYGALCNRVDRPADARAAFQDAIQLSADTEFAVNALCGASAPAAERAERCRFVATELQRQSAVGDGCWAWAPHARAVLPADEVLGVCERLFARRSELWQVWSVLAAQHRAMGHPDRALEVATRMTQRFPMLPRAWVDLADTHEALGDRAQQVVALERALRLNPAWVEAARKCAEAYEAQGDHPAAIALLERAATRDPTNAGHHGWLAEALWNAGERERALDAIERALELAADYEWAWRCLDRWSTVAGARERARATARAAVERAPGAPQAWIWLARLLDDPAALEERLAACDRAAACDPTGFEPHDLRAWLLGEAGRWDEALAACRPAALAEPRPLELRGREGWVLGQQGRHAEAIAVLEPLVAEAPDYFWAWQRLADYREEVGDTAGALAAAEEMVRVAPEDAVAYGYRGHAHRLLEAWDAAVADFARAFDLDPQYEFAGFALFDRQLATGALDAAGATLDRLDAGGRDQLRTVRRVLLAKARGDRPALYDALVGALPDPALGDWAIERVAELAESAAHRETVLGALATAAAGQAAPSEALGVIWARALLAAGRRRAAVQLLERLPAAAPAWQGAADTAVRGLARAQRTREVVRLLRRYRPAFQAHPQLWGHGAFALTTVGRHAEVVRWMAGWEHRPGVEPWMLLNLSVAYRFLGQDAAAQNVAEAALRLPPDHMADRLRVWAACDRAIAGDVAGARDLLAAINVEALALHHQFLHRVAEVVCAARGGGRAEAVAARRALDEARAGYGAAARRFAQRRVYRRAVRCVARCAGGLAARWWQLRRSWNG